MTIRINTLKIRGYKNLENIDIKFLTDKNTTVLIGNNGCGKSNILEVIVAIFAGLYNRAKFAPDFEYDINYDIDNLNVEIHYCKKKYDSITISSDIMNETVDVSYFISKRKECIPKNIIACCSGEDTRLYEQYFNPFYEQYIKEIFKADNLPQLRFCYIDKKCWTISLLTLFLYDFSVYEDIADFCNNVLGIKRIVNITFHYNVNKINKWKGAAVLDLIKKINTINGIPILSAKNTKLSFEEFINKIINIDPKSFFESIYAATLSGIKSPIIGIDLEIELNNGEIISVKDLSEGEKKYLLIKFVLEVYGDENSILLFDEPDAYIHISRKKKLQELFYKYPNRDNVITTHSPTLTQCFDDCDIVGLGKTINNSAKIIEPNKQLIVSELTNNMWNIQEQNIFLSSNKKLTLLVEGKTDKMHIEAAYEQLKDDYTGLDFDIFSMNSSEHIREVLIGLNSADYKWDKKFIGIFDNDTAGKKDINNGFDKYSEGKKHIKRVKFNNDSPSNTFFAVLLPTKENWDKDFTIENCYDADKYQDAYIEAVEDKKGHFENLSIDKIAEDIKNKSKIKLAEKAKSFNKEDFSGFKKLFDIINEINYLG